MTMQLLFVIPARGGSKGIPGKNIKPFNGKPLIYYSIELARACAQDRDICVTTDSAEIIECVNRTGLQVPFVRPEHLASDTAGSYEVLQHALGFYDARGDRYDAILLLQPTSPFRETRHLREAIGLYDEVLDMVVSVKESKANPYYNLFEENEENLLTLSKGDGRYQRRQDVPAVYEYNGAIYLINTRSLRSKRSFREFTAIRKYVMDERYSIDLDTMEDWDYAEYQIKRK